MSDEAAKAHNHPRMEFKDYREIYNIYRDYVVHEGDLINTRLMWILTIHGFLYATYGLTIQKEMEIIQKIPSCYSMMVCPTPPVVYTLIQAQSFLLFISLIGLLISLFGMTSITAAQNAAANVDAIFNSEANSAHKLKSLKDGNLLEFDSNKPLDLDDGTSIVYLTKDGYILPYIRGGALKSNIGRGNKASSAIPRILAGGWLASLAVLIGITIINYRIFI